MRNERKRMPVVLVIEDDPWVRALETSVLGELGFETLEASNGYSALRLAASRTPDLILLDLSLPELHGVQVLEAFRSDPRTRMVPLVVISAHLDTLTLQQAETVDALVPKPFDVGQLEGALRQAFERGSQRRLHVRLPGAGQQPGSARGRRGKHPPLGRPVQEQVSPPLRSRFAHS